MLHSILFANVYAGTAIDAVTISKERSASSKTPVIYVCHLFLLKFL